MRQPFRIFVFGILLCGNCHLLVAQDLPPTPPPNAPTRLLRIYDDNDFANIRGPGTDDAYTNGTRIDLFYTLPHPSRWLVDKALPKTGDSSINVYGWGIMQLMYTPNDLSRTDYQPNDYPYAGALIAAHTLYSYNPVKKYDLQTELLLGVIGPAALTSQTQTLLHRLMQFQRPMGWSHQFHNDVLLNINFTAEKQLAAWGSAVEIIGGGQAFCGTMLNGIGVYPLIRIGHMNPYFQGYLSQYSGSRSYSMSGHPRKWQAYLVLKPEGQLFFTNALLQGGLFTGNPNVPKGKETPKIGAVTSAQASQAPVPYHDLRTFVCSVNYGAVISSGDISISFTQNTASSMLKGLYSHDVENISLYFSW
jgi:lipid A 3-O-deacylase